MFGAARARDVAQVRDLRACVVITITNPEHDRRESTRGYPSRPGQPYHSHRRRLWLTHMQPVAIDIEIWPSSITFDAGETLRLVIQGTDVHKAPGSRFELRHWPLHNYGHHIVYTGGTCDSHLLLPVVSG
jgi:predicted acyl esterase